METWNENLYSSISFGSFILNAQYYRGTNGYYWALKSQACHFGTSQYTSHIPCMHEHPQYIIEKHTRLIYTWMLRKEKDIYCILMTQRSSAKMVFSEMTE